MIASYTKSHALLLVLVLAVYEVIYPSEKIWSSRDRTPVRPPVRPSAPQAYQCKITQSTGMATQMQLEVILAGNRLATGVL